MDGICRRLHRHAGTARRGYSGRSADQAGESERAESARARPDNVEILGPIPAAPFRVRGRVRWQLAVKGAEGTALRQAVQATLAELEKAGRAGGLRYDIDVDPQSLL